MRIFVVTFSADTFLDWAIAAPVAALEDPAAAEQLLIERRLVRGRTLQLSYAPFDHVNREARIAIVGLTPGRRQAADALIAYRTAVLTGSTRADALRIAKGTASFSGPMRRNLIRMLDRIGVPGLLRLQSTAELWSTAGDLVHFTSAVRYPLFIDGANWSGSPNALATPEIRRWVETWTGSELAEIGNALLVPLGGASASALLHLASLGLVDREAILDGLPHPSGANAERIACFLGDKPVEMASGKTNGDALVATRLRLERQLGALSNSVIITNSPNRE